MMNGQTRAGKNTRDQRVQRTYRKLIGALEELLCEIAVDQITVKQVCKSAGIQRTTFYQHFRDLQDFLEWYILQKQEEFRAHMPQKVSAGEAQDIYLSLAQSILNYLKKNEKLVKATINTQINGKMLLDLYISTCMSSLVDALEDASELERKTGNTPISFLAQFYVGGLISVFRWWVMNDKPITEAEFMNYLRLRTERVPKE
ncbi:MAG: TetR/AcrR family transcriptional regulator C-terminal domain-containing protein [Clostridia bacterium]|nr:TetR/AcrR family transcriptional regulator C-terminal domain-containing protein [Clostridia bacterium]